MQMRGKRRKLWAAPCRLVAWLRNCHNLDQKKDITRLQLGIGKVRYLEAARYFTLDGEERIYVLGPRPASHKRSSRACYTLPDDPRPWAVVSYRDDTLPTKAVDGEPFFMLGLAAEDAGGPEPMAVTVPNPYKEVWLPEPAAQAA